MSRGRRGQGRGIQSASVVPNDEGAHLAVARLRDALPSGSMMAVSQAATDTHPHITTWAARLGSRLPWAPRPRDEIARFFGDFAPVDPGLVPVREWRPDAPTATPPEQTWLVGGVGIKL